MKKNRKILSIILCFSIVFSILFIKNTPTAKAFYPVAASIANMIPEAFSAVGITGQWVSTLAVWVADNIQAILLVATKMAALLAVQAITQAIIGEGGGGVISDWNNYIYVAPQQRAMAQMNSFFNTVSRGRLSSLNYEGVGPNYDAYLVAQARQAIGGQAFVTNLQDQVTDPTQLFSAGNMKGIMAYMRCANNVPCYTLTSTAQYNLELAKATEIAKLQQDRGFLPVKKNGKITQPAAILSSALSQIDQLGTQIIMNTDVKASTTAGLAQIAAGAGINIAARSLNYAAASDEGKAAIRDKNDQFPFSASYALNGGVAIKVGGVNFNTGAGAINLQLRIGNTCANASGTVAADGATVSINGRKMATIDGQNYDCATTSQTSGTVPSVNINLPSYSCTPGAGPSNASCEIWFGAEYKCGAAGRCTK